jgi:hypothetical protein
MTSLRISTEYRLACLLVRLSYGLSAFFKQARFQNMMDAHRLRLKLTGLLPSKNEAG